MPISLLEFNSPLRHKNVEPIRSGTGNIAGNIINLKLNTFNEKLEN